MIDKYDLIILHELQANARISWVELAERCNLSASACQRRTAALQQSGIIERFTLSVDAQALGFDVEAFVAVNIERQNMQHAGDFRAVMMTLPEVQSCHMLSGSVDFMLHVIARDLRAFGQFIQTEILSLPGVKDATSSIVLEQIKNTQMIPAKR